jgi:hypothetical protein
VTDLERLWLGALQDVVGRAAHEVKDALNGVSLNLEVIRSRASRPNGSGGLSDFAAAAADQLEKLSARTEALLFLSRMPRTPAEPADVSVTLKHLATLLVPATKADGGTLAVEGYDVSIPTLAPAQATRLALAAGLLAITKEGGSSRCRLEAHDGTVVHFSHESAPACTLDPAVVAAIGEHQIRASTSGSELRIDFPSVR